MMIRISGNPYHANQQCTAEISVNGMVLKHGGLDELEQLPEPRNRHERRAREAARRRAAVQVGAPSRARSSAGPVGT